MVKIFGVFDAEGNPQGFYADDVWKPEDMPEGAVEISEEVWQALLSNGGSRYVEGGVLMLEPEEEPDVV